MAAKTADGPKGQVVARRESKYKFPDYRKSEIAWKYIRRGLCTVGRHGLAVSLLPVAASLVVRHLNSYFAAGPLVPAAIC